MTDRGDGPFLDFATDDAVPGPWFVQACQTLEIDAVGSLVVERCLRVFPPDVADARFADYLRLSVMENLHSLRDLLCRRTDLSRLELEQPLSFATIQAELRVPQASLQRSYRVSFLTVWDEWSRTIRSHLKEQGIDTAQSDEAQAYLTRAIFTYQDFVTSRAAESYAKVESALSRSKARVQQQLIRELLAGSGDVLPTHDLLLLDYDIHAHHVAIVLSGTGEEAAVRLARDLRAAARTRDSLIHRLSIDSSAVWLGSPSAFSPSSLDAIQQALVRAGGRAAMGDPHQGPGGLVQSFREAEQADLVGGQTDPRIVRYSDVMLDILLLQDRWLAESFVRRVLGPLADDTTEAGRLRATMDASLRHSTHVAAAEELEVHEHTVRNRLARIEEILGSGLRERRTEIEVALRLRRTLHGEQTAAGS